MNLVRSKRQAVTQGKYVEGSIYLIRENTIFAKIKRFFTGNYYNDCIIIAPVFNKLCVFNYSFGRIILKSDLTLLEKSEIKEIYKDKSVTNKYFYAKKYLKEWQNQAK